VEEEHVDVVVVGGGAMGLATAWWAALDGSVVVLERFGAGHHRGASHGAERIFRHAHVDPAYVEMALAAEGGWRQLERATGRTLIHRVGFVEHGGAAELDRLALVAEQVGVATEWLTAAESEARWPTMCFTTDVLFQPEAGWIRADDALAGLAGQATARGADLRYGTPVGTIEPAADDGGLRVHTAGTTFRARTVVVTVGAWTTDLVPVDHLPKLTTTEEHVFFFRPRSPTERPLPFLHEPAPNKEPEPEGELVRYGLPAADGLVKVGEHHSGAVTTGDDRTFVTEPPRVERIERYVAQWLPGLVPEVVDMTTCLYTSTPTHEFVVDRVGPAVVGAGFSGLGFKYVPEIGRRLAELARAAR
jgi:sarcosine oxidase